MGWHSSRTGPDIAPNPKLSLGSGLAKLDRNRTLAALIYSLPIVVYTAVCTE